MDSPKTRPVTAIPPRESPTSGQLNQRVRSLRLSNVPERRLNLRAILGWLTVVAMVVGGSLWIYRTWFQGDPRVETAQADSADKGGAATTALKPSLPNPPSTTAQTPGLPAVAPGEVVLESKGYIIPAHQILVSPKVSGMILTLNVEEGKRVNKGDVLAVLESTEYQADFNRAKAAVALAAARLDELKAGPRIQEIKQASAELSEAQAQMKQLAAQFQRQQQLRQSGSITQQEFEVAESEFKVQEKRVERLFQAWQLLDIGTRSERIAAAEAELQQVEADLLKAEWRLGNCTIRAPISGTILKKNAEEGNIVNPIAFNGSFSLCEMADLADLEADLNIQERDVSVVKVGQKCRIRAEAWPDRLYDGYVSRLMPIADRAKGAVPVRVKIKVPPAEEGIYLKPEMGAIVTFLNSTVAPSAPEATAAAFSPQPTDTAPAGMPVSAAAP